MKRKILLIFIFIQLSVILIVGIKSTLDGYYGFYYHQKKKPNNVLHEYLSQILELSPIKYYLSYTGIETGYGFFAPNVASQFVLVFEMKNQDGQIIEKRYLPYLKDKESVIRFTTSFSLFLDGMDEDKGRLYKDYTKVIAKQMGYSIFKNIKNANSYTVNTYLYEHSRLNQSGGTQKFLIPVEKYEFN